MEIGAAALLVLVIVTVLWHTRAASTRSPQALAFTTTLAAALFLGSGAVGFRLQRAADVSGGTRWSPEVIWPQVWLGIALLAVAVICWRRAVRDVERRLRR